jgi:hypothetical protein
MENINWRIIQGYENYMVSENGLIKNGKTNHILKPAIEKRGYWTRSQLQDYLKHLKRLKLPKTRVRSCR